jgi:hypothetical protein
MIGELYINGVLVDLDDTAPFPITYNLSDIKDLSKRKGTSTKTVSLPWTRTNTELFKMLYVPSSASVQDFDPSIKAQAKYYYNSILLFNGYAQLQRSILNKSFELTLFSEVIDYVSEMAKIKINELDFSEYNHSLTRQHQVDTWGGTVVLNGTDTNLLNQGKGYYYGLTENGYNRPAFDEFRVTDIPPQVYVYEVLLKLFERVGIVWDSQILESAFFKRLLLCYGGGELPNISQAQADDDSVFSEEVLSVQGLNTAVPAFYEASLYFFSTLINQRPIQSVTTTDLLSQVITASPLSIRAKTKGLFQVQYNGEHTFDFDLIAQFTGVVTSVFIRYNLQIQTLVNGSVIAIDNVYNGSISGSSMSYSETFNFAYTRDLNLEINDVVNLNLILTIGENLPFSNAVIFSPSVAGENLRYEYDLQTVSSNINLQKQPQQLTPGGTVYLSAFMPQMTGDVFFKGILTMFNMYVNSNDNDPTILEIESFDDFYLTTSEDWSKKINYNEDVTITPTLNLATRRYAFQFTPDKDYWNERYRQETNKNYGDLIVDSQSQYSNDETVYQLPFAQKLMVDIPNLNDTVTGLIMPTNITLQEGVIKPFKGTCFIAQRLRLGTVEWTHIDEDDNPHVEYTTPQIGHARFFLSTLGGIEPFDLNFSVPDKVYFTTPTNYPIDNLYQRHHQKQINRIVNKFGKMIECECRLLPLDLNRLSLRQPKIIDGVKYIVQKISEYDAQQQQDTKVELLKL